MKFEEMEREGLIKRLPVDKKKVIESFELAKRDLKIAEKILGEDHDWAFSISYNAMLQAARALMFSRGYRPAGDAQHVSVLRFVEESFGRNFTDGVLVFDRMRRKRHMAVYGKVGSISKTEANNSVKWAREFVEEIRKILTKGGFL